MRFVNGEGESVHIGGNVSQEYVLCLQLLCNSSGNQQTYFCSTLKCDYCVIQ